jgi:DNA adenine methylase
MRLRATDPSTLDPIRRAARFLYLNRYCFNGLYRTNTSGRFNVPYAPSKSGKLPDWDAFSAAALLLSRAKLLEADFEDVLLKHVRAGDFVYLDPPYAVQNRRVFRQYDAVSFGVDDLERLAVALHALDATGARFLVSYAFCKEAIAAFKGWRITKTFVHRNISGFAQHRRLAAELLVSN